MFLTDFLLFIVFQLLIVYPLGKTILNFMGMKFWLIPSLVFGVNIGIVVLTIAALILGYTNNYYLLPLIAVISLILFFLQIRNIKFSKFNIRGILKLPDLVVISTILLCVLIQSFIVFPNGVSTGGILRVKNVFTEDGMWHIAIINNLKKSIPPSNPIFAGEKLTNYNYFSDIYIAVIQKFTHIKTLTLYFKLIGPFLALLCAVSLYFILKVLTGNQIIAGMGVLLITLASTYYYIFGIFKPGLNINPSTFFGNDYVSRMVNYQLSFSYLIITSFLYLLLHRKDSFRFIIIASFLISSGIGFKSYGTILIIPALYIVGFYNIFRKKFDLIKIAFLSSIFIAVLVYLFLGSGQAIKTVFTFDPFWLIGNIFTDPLRFSSAGWAASRSYYLDSNNYPGIAYLYFKGLVIFLFTQFGLKILGFLYILKIKENKERDVILLISIIALTGIIMPLIFTQGGVKWNTIQFIWYSSFGLGILSVLLISGFQKKIGLKLILIILLSVWVSYLPGVLHYSKFYLSDAGNLTTYNFQGTQESYKAARFLSGQPDGVLLLDSKYSQTPFIMAISEKNAYFADESILSNLFLDWYTRDQRTKLFFDNFTSSEYKEKFLKENNISYVFTAKDTLRPARYLDNIFNNDEVWIYRTKF
ncbi:MAG: hypothetical protein ACD_32C00013G0002 [uncultured bacterium]|uniref:Glycosyltransferase RgtA/B/C/D-like domain-containing protein n=1 Tax=Candidatus Daviesbacteria bacterium GW2011_GWC2_40_12 TaxID=1618431 RepID=A0A0G0TXI7_9BACT|nr:MAG: hypothetical protein ACD_32C00013G0002 [uncultured bacterium]KKR17293.1 MAG: hypothetical protein UT45_C0002G0122 [Candidatus Daviesbacteria bacterium GW2011_GWA2_39_33]KKR42692.1 MAG: hypothetical protein UT77_C0001G0143 [Candidatus Daviesbacteria bacterium GW2011_GWC2_40_12]OGE21365.1 MAG: hypothetical protein A2778_04325 [Candidatus Daviesbacteria bacterium RIFCSPHIGHO2_01_FULL_40_24]OGE30117.1 MAG: hypothetical protein A3C29_01795 [Candidatus Daviesbacteria bacterium RIFCSPHIGHO2_02